MTKENKRKASRFPRYNDTTVTADRLNVFITLGTGVITISPSDVIRTILGNGTDRQELVLFDIRLPRIFWLSWSVQV